MKRNITINLLGSLYAIDEDAYELLKRYMDSMKSYFRSMEGGEEIADDIEHRVAELLWQEKARGVEAINIETIKGIIEKIGKPDEINDSANEAATDSERQPDGDNTETTTAADSSKDFLTVMRNWLGSMKGRYLYRDPNDKILGGVCAGLARFTDLGSPLSWRLGTIIIALLPMFTIANLNIPLPVIIAIVYAVMWAIVPMPTAPEDRLRMKGQAVNHENITNEIIEEADNVSSAIEPQPVRRNNGCLSLLFKLVLVILLLPFIIAMSMLFLAVLFFLSVATQLADTLFPFAFGGNDDWLMNYWSNNSLTLVFLALGAALLISIPVYCIYRTLRGSGKPITAQGVITAAILWILSLAVVIFATTSLVMRYDAAHYNYVNLKFHTPGTTTGIPPHPDDTTAVDTVGYME